MKLSKGNLSVLKRLFKSEAYKISNFPGVSFYVGPLDIDSEGNYHFYWEVWCSAEFSKGCKMTEKGNLNDYPEKIVLDMLDLTSLWLLPVKDKILDFAQDELNRRREINTDTRDDIERIYKLNITAK